MLYLYTNFKLFFLGDWYSLKKWPWQFSFLKRKIVIWNYRWCALETFTNWHTLCDMNLSHTWNAWLSSFCVILASTLLKWRRLMCRARMRCRLYSFKFLERIFWNFSSGLICSGSGCTESKTSNWSKTWFKAFMTHNHHE